MNTNRFSLFTRIILVPAFVAAVLFQASLVSANSPVRERVLMEGYILAGVCDFDVEVAFPDEKLYETTFYNQDGEIVMVIDSGKVFVTLTNLSNGATLDANISGPGQWIFYPDGSLQKLHWTGTWLMYGPNQFLSLPPLVIYAGSVSAEWDSSGNFVDGGFVGNYIDVCAVLSG